jgi:hypothetical protein
MTAEMRNRLVYVIKHDPIRYVVKPKYFIFWTVQNLDGVVFRDFYMSHEKAQNYCDLLNSVYSLGYAVGCASIARALLDS